MAASLSDRLLQLEGEKQESLSTAEVTREGKMEQQGSPLFRYQIDETPSLTIDIDKHEERLIREVIVLRDGTLVTRSTDNLIERWSPTTGDLLNTYIHFQTVRCIAELNDDCIVTGAGREARVWDKHTRKCRSVRQLYTGFGCILSLRRFSIQSTVWCGMEDGIITVWNADNMVYPLEFRAHAGAVDCLCELSDGTVVSGARYESKLKRWNAETKQVIATIVGHADSGPVLGLRNKAIASISKENTMIVSSVSTGDKHTDDVNGMVEMADGTIITTSGKTIRLWDIRKQKMVATYETSGLIASIGLLTDGSIVIGFVAGYMERRDTWFK